VDKDNRLTYARKIVWDYLNEREKKEVMDTGEEYKRFIGRAKTEREAVALAVEFLQQRGFVTLDSLRRPLQPGDKVYAVIKDKSLVMAVVGKQRPEAGANIIGAHVDSPRLDLKVHPLYEETGLALLKTHYYGGIKKYHWLALPLALHGVVYRSDGSRVNVCLGENIDDPVFTITDLLPHLAKEQFEKKVQEAFPGEKLNALCGALPAGNRDEQERIKKNVLNLLHHKYGINEEDLVSAELELVPAIQPRDVGLDRALVGAYGQDDRVCAYALLSAMGQVKQPEHTAVGIMADKEEIGSYGNTGMQSEFLANFLAELLEKSAGNYSELQLRRFLASSRAISADVNAAMDPDFEDVMEKNNAARLGCGVVITKYTGSGGKKGANDAHAAYMAHIRSLFHRHGVIWQAGELGKVDQGGGGTIAHLLAVFGMDVVDCGAALLGMHSPFEISHKADIYMMCRAYLAFLQN